jgi:hypothetical protein
MIRLWDLRELAEKCGESDFLLAELTLLGKIPHRMVRGSPLYDPSNLGKLANKMLANRSKHNTTQDNGKHGDTGS